MTKFLIYLPYSEFIDSYGHKALGGIPLGFVQAGYDTVLIVGIMKSAQFRRNNIKIYETGNLDDKYVLEAGTTKKKIIPRISNILNFNEYKKVYRILKKEKPDLFMAYNNSTLTPFIVGRYKLFCKFHNIKTKLILKLDNDGSDIEEIQGVKKLAVSLYYRMLGHIFYDVITETTCGFDIFSKFKGIAKKIRTVPNTVSDDFLNNNKKTFDKTIISVSRITPVKGIERLIGAFESIAAKYPYWNLKIIGPIDDKTYYNSLADLIRSYNMQTRISFTGEKSREELIRIYNSASIFCLFSNHESFAISRLEAIAMGLYVITTDAGCARDLMRFGIHIMDNNTVECGSKCIEEGIAAIEYGRFVPNELKIPSYRELAIQIATDAIRKDGSS
jgi:glycosyltransferase involved in cell wall biosynthesis